MNTMNDVPELQAPEELSLPDVSPRQKLITLLEFIKMSFNLNQTGKNTAVNIFMKWLCQLYLDYFQYHLDEAKEIGKKYENVLVALIDPIYYVRIVRFHHRMSCAEAVGYGDDLWDEACLVKTQLEAFHEMFGCISGTVIGYRVEELDRYLSTKSYQGADPDKIPENVPKHHWWWFMFNGKRWDEDEGVIDI